MAWRWFFFFSSSLKAFITIKNYEWITIRKEKKGKVKTVMLSEESVRKMLLFLVADSSGSLMICRISVQWISPEISSAELLKHLHTVLWNHHLVLIIINLELKSLKFQAQWQALPTLIFITLIRITSYKPIKTQHPPENSLKIPIFNETLERNVLRRPSIYHPQS